jgi:arsenate reductase (thioredoxin)
MVNTDAHEVVRKGYADIARGGASCCGPAKSCCCGNGDAAGVARAVGKKLKILFLCTGNSCRSQMAEGWARHLKSDVIEPYSAGIETHGLNRLAVKAMAEVGVDISGQWSKSVDAVKDVPFDYVVTVCGHANESCPMWLSGKAKVIHVGFDDPPALARDTKTEEDALAHYRCVRDEIRDYVHAMPENLLSGRHRVGIRRKA